MEQGRSIAFEKQGVYLTIPSRMPRVMVKTLPIEVPIGIQATTGIQPIRPIINIVLYNRDDPNNYLTEFNPPFEIQVRYTADDLSEANARGADLKLAFWNGSEWNLFTHAKHNFELHPNADPSTGGIGTVKISSWGDPPIAWVT
jgi:hypothetical protein